MADVSTVRSQLNLTLRILELQAAKYGLAYAPPTITIKIQDIQRMIEALDLYTGDALQRTAFNYQLMVNEFTIRLD